MTRAVFDDIVVAESDHVRMVEGIAYFPHQDVDLERLVESATTSRCFWKGKARHWHVDTGDEVVPDAAFAYEKPWPLARRLVADRVGFWRGVSIE